MWSKQICLKESKSISSLYCLAKFWSAPVKNAWGKKIPLIQKSGGGFPRSYHIWKNSHLARMSRYQLLRGLSERGPFATHSAGCSLTNSDFPRDSRSNDMTTRPFSAFLNSIRCSSIAHSSLLYRRHSCLTTVFIDCS